MNIEPPWALDHPDADASSLRKRGGAGGTGSKSSRGSAGMSGNRGTKAAGGAMGGTPADAGTADETVLVVTDASNAGGSAEADPTGGTGGLGGAATGTGLDTGSGGGVVFVSASTGGMAGRAGAGTGGTTEVPDAAPARDSFSPDGPCALCAIRPALVHRYSFNGTGATVTDSVGTAHGKVVNTQLLNSGMLLLAGGSSGQYVDFPDRLLSTLTSATLEIWVSWTGGNSNQRILDFGSSALVNGKFQATTTVIISPNSAPDGIPPRLRASYSNQVSHSGTFVDAPKTLDMGMMKQIVVVLDGQSHTISMYLNGVLQGQTGGLGALSQLNDNNNWLGKSQYSDDPGFSGMYYEFRIYDAALTADQVQAVHAAGPSASFNQ